MKRVFLIGLLAAGALVIGSSALLAAPSDVVRARITGLRELGAAFKAVNDGLRGSEMQSVLIQQSARQIRNAARDQYRWFPQGSGPQPGVKTAAKPEIWSQAARFRAAQDAFARQADVFFQAASAGSPAAIRAEARKLGANCKSCHDTFRLPQS
ncbi:cytochrome c [Novosphingobium sp. G106]|uniref:c-type cytochrome n=1 Tax=Novosphingobium sp. G106 TaxID=2849500 RepID=UPI001C2D6141|nr:cytochrome c [Novosphingobium sp. G106]MBV1686246.1 cytochrome c [Novosphingobium sp. G106]